MYLQYPYYKNNKTNHNFDEIIVVVPENWENIISKELNEICSLSKVISGGKSLNCFVLTVLVLFFA